jgi:Tfp pilus assembly protein PilV
MNVFARPILRGGRGFSLIEASMATLVVAVMLTAMLRTVGAARIAQYKSADAMRGQLLAADLMAEIIQLPYQDPGNAPVFGPEAGELTRASFNDVDDYNNWSESPPQNRDGSTMLNTTGWSRQATVAWVSAADLKTTSPSETSVKRVIVSVKHNGQLVASKTAIVTNIP